MLLVLQYTKSVIARVIKLQQRYYRYSGKTVWSHRYPNSIATFDLLVLIDRLQLQSSAVEFAVQDMHKASTDHTRDLAQMGLTTAYVLCLFFHSFMCVLFPE